MNKSLLAAGLATAIASPFAMAGVIQIDLNGTQTFPGIQIQDPGSSRGNMLMQNTLSGAAGGGTVGIGVVYLQNSFGISPTNCPAFTYGLCTLSVELAFPVNTTTNQVGGGVGSSMNLVQNLLGGPATFSIWLQETLGPAGGTTPNAATGVGYNSGKLLASGTASIDPSTTFNFIQSSPGAAGAMAINNPTLSITGAGSANFDINLTVVSVNTSYVLNNIAASIIDLVVTDALSLTYSTSTVPPLLASTGPGSFNNGAVTPNFGVDGTNDLECGALVTCDLQASANSTLEFGADAVPEPGVLALLGTGFSLMGGFVSRRRQRS